jgi:HEAT repeat protein
LDSTPLRPTPSPGDSRPARASGGPAGDLAASPARAAEEWFRLLVRAFKVRRLYRSDNPVLTEMREQLHRTLASNLRRFGAWTLDVTPTEILLGGEVVVHPRRIVENLDEVPSREDQLPFLLYRDGIRGMTFLPGIPRHDTDAFLDALQTTGGRQSTGDDLVTLVWQANASHLRFEVVPLEQTIQLSSGQGPGGGSADESGLSYAWSPAGVEVRAELQQLAGTRGLHRDGDDAWSLPVDFMNVADAYQRLLPSFDEGRARLRADWAAEANFDWRLQVPATFRYALALSPGEQTRRDLAHAAATWFESAIERAAWDEAQMALALFEEFELHPESRQDVLRAALSRADVLEVTERLDEATAADQGSFFLLLVSLGAPAIDLAFGVLGKSVRSRTRAAAVTALSYMVSDDPRRLLPVLRDERWFVVRNAVFILGQIGGAEAAEMLATVVRHPELRVRRAVVEALGNVPVEQRLTILGPQLQTTELGLLAATLGTLTRERDPRVATLILDRLRMRDVLNQGEVRALLLQALADLEPALAIPELEADLHRGGWLARRSYERTAAARVLARIGTPEALAVLERGLRSRADSVRRACRETMPRRAA